MVSAPRRSVGNSIFAATAACNHSVRPPADFFTSANRLRWMLDQLDAADFVLVICTRTYYRRFRGHEQPGKGKGGDWEGAFITQEIYDSRSRTLKFVPVIFSISDGTFIPEPLRSINYFALTSEADYQALYDSLLEQSGVH